MSQTGNDDREAADRRFLEKYTGEAATEAETLQALRAAIAYGKTLLRRPASGIVISHNASPSDCRSTE